MLSRNFCRAFSSPRVRMRTYASMFLFYIALFFRGLGERTSFLFLYKWRRRSPPVRVLSAEYDDGTVFIHTDSDVLERAYTPAILVPPFAADFLSLDGVSIIRRKHALELRAPLSTLLDVQRDISALTPAYLFLPPERQFLLDNNLSIGSEIVGGMPSLSLPLASSPRDARAYLLRSPRGLAPRTFVENALYLARIPADTSVLDSIFLDPDALRVVLELNLSPENVLLGASGTLLPSSRVRLHLPLPVALRSTDPVFARKQGGAHVSYSSGSIAPLSDALLITGDYDVVYPVHSSPSPLAVIPSAVLSLLRLFHHISNAVRPRSSNILDVAFNSSSRRAVSAYSYLQAIADILLPLASYLASSNALTPLGRESLVAGWELRRREPKLYSRLYGKNHTCLPALSELEYFLLALSSLPLELPRWWRRQRV